MSSPGLTLVELLVAVALGSVLCLAGATLVMKSNKVFLQDEQLARLQENGHYALRLLSRELSMAGFYGEALPGNIAPAPAGGEECYRHLVKIDAALAHYDNLSVAGASAAGSVLPPGCTRPGDHQDSADAVLVRRTMDRPALHWDGAHISTRDAMLYLRIDETGAVLGRGSDDLAGGASLWRFHPQLFFLRSYSRTRGDGLPALCRIRLSPETERTAPVECLVEGVEQMQLEFGIDSDGDRQPDRYVSLLQAADVPSAVTARIQLLVRSPLPLPGHRDDNIYKLGNIRVEAPGDGYIRRVLVTSVRLRNSDVYRS